ncbi:hypothetical protein QN399_00900 [Pseudomonas sp. 10C3]|uniref:phage tail assembly chaperone n=1 Tax=Pseudomonas sp. 10C3 TaxID=3118753 RepID=UPI002E7FCF14|nr:hypothetical protein [Pseudomonas sp. 10C3]MEE3504833.1 hypothetical protein [Pseudomonas sp. 10C3]
MSEFDLDENTYRVGKLDAFKQFHLSRKIAPIIPTLIPVFMKLQASSAIAKDNGSTPSPLSGDLSSMAEVMIPFADGIAAMPDATAEFILATCLGAVSRKQGNAWSPVWSASQNICMFDDLDIGVMIRLSVRVITESLGPFLRGMLTGQSTPKA